MTYDKRQILNPKCKYEDVVKFKVDTSPFCCITIVLLGLDFKFSCNLMNLKNENKNLKK